MITMVQVHSMPAKINYFQGYWAKPLDIHFQPDAKPKAFSCLAIPVSHHCKLKVKSDIDRDVRLGIIKPLPLGTPTIWCSKMVVVPKKDATPHCTVDLQFVNPATFRQTHCNPSPFTNTKKTVLDAWNGYYTLSLYSSCQKCYHLHH